MSVFEVEPFTLKIVPSPVSVLASVKVTLAVGALLRRTVKLASPPFSSVSLETALT